MEGSAASELAGESTAVTFTTESVALDLATMSLINPTAGRPQVTAASANAATLVLGGSGSQRYSGRGILNLGQILTDAATHRGVEISFKCDAGTAMDWSESISGSSYWARSFRFGLGLGGDPFSQETLSSNYNYTHDWLQHINNSAKGLFVDFTGASWAYFRDVQVSNIGELSQGTYSGSTKVEKNGHGYFAASVRPDYRPRDFATDFDGTKTIKLRFIFSDEGRLRVEQWVDADFVGVWLSHFIVREADYLNQDIYLYIGNYVSNATTKVRDISITEMAINRLVSVNMPAKKRLSTRDFSTSRVKAIKGTDLFRDGVAMASESDYLAIIKQFLTGVGYNGDGGCNWDLIYEDATRLVVRAKTGARDYWRLTMHPISNDANKYTLDEVDFSFTQLTVESFKSMSDIDTGFSPLVKHADFEDGLIPLLGMQHLGTSWSSRRTHVSFEKEPYVPVSDWVLIASDKTVVFLGAGSSSESISTKVASELIAFGEYGTIMEGSDSNSFLISTHEFNNFYRHYGPAPWVMSSNSAGFDIRGEWFSARDNAGFKPYWIAPVGGFNYTKSEEDSPSHKSSVTGAPVLTPLTISCKKESVSVDGWLPQLNSVRNMYGGYVNISNYYNDPANIRRPFDYPEVFDAPPTLDTFNHAGKDYLYAPSSLGNPGDRSNATSYNYMISVRSMSCLAVSLDEEDWI